MAKMVEAVPPALRRSLVQIWCDSKAQACYTVYFKSGVPDEMAELVLDSLETASGGHNGIWVEGSKVQPRDPDWPGDDMI